MLTLTHTVCRCLGLRIDFIFAAASVGATTKESLVPELLLLIRDAIPPALCPLTSSSRTRSCERKCLLSLGSMCCYSSKRGECRNRLCSIDSREISLRDGKAIWLLIRSRVESRGRAPRQDLLRGQPAIIPRRRNPRLSHLSEAKHPHFRVRLRICAHSPSVECDAPPMAV